MTTLEYNTELLSPYNNILLSEATFRDQQGIGASN